MKKKIAVIDFLFNWPPDGGARTDIKEIITRFNNDFTVKLFIPEMEFGFNRGKNAEKIGVETEKIKTDVFNFNFFSYPKKLKEKIDEYNPDLIFFGDGWFIKPAVISYFKNYKYIIRFYAYEGLCLRQHGIFFKNNSLCEKNYLTGNFEDWLSCSFCALEWLITSRSKVFIQEYFGSLAFLPSYKKIVIESIRNASSIICYNDFIKDKLSPFNNNIHKIPSGIDLTNFVFNNSEHPDLKNKKNINILMAGRASDPAKGFHILYKAFKILCKKYTNISLNITAENGFILNENNIKIIPWLPQEKLSEVYKNADICIVPSIWPEPFGIVTLEAMACGVPVIVSDSIGPGSVVKHKENGLIYRKFDAEDLIEKIEMYINDSKLCNSVKKKAYETVQEYSWDRVYLKIKNILEK
ncbi:glycosyltransferase family 4 protein [Candidatus Dependentiae bacterium]|nr:glycosyltransferase family 4 protein [Candidatus Dependentiae bacterium]